MSLDLTADIIDIRDIIARIEELEEDTAGIRSGSVLNAGEFLKAYRGFHYPHIGASDLVLEELANLTAIMDELAGYGGDEKWRGEWYPITLIADHYFNEYMDQMLEDCGEIPANLPSYLIIRVDYSALQMDYSSVEIDGCTYWYR